MCATSLVHFTTTNSDCYANRCPPTTTPKQSTSLRSLSSKCATFSFSTLSLFPDRFPQYSPSSSQMLKHGRAGVPLEVMGLMLGEFVDEFTVRVTGQLLALFSPVALLTPSQPRRLRHAAIGYRSIRRSCRSRIPNQDARYAQANWKVSPASPHLLHV